MDSVSHNVFIELSNNIHGGYGWELGSYLWSPTRTKNDRKRWEIMKDPLPGDLIIHSMKKNSSTHRFYGISYVESKFKITDDEPTIPGNWSKSKGHKQYYKIKLKNFSKFDNNYLYVSEFLNLYRSKLSASIDAFYDSTKTKPKEIYLARVNSQDYDLIKDYINNNCKSDPFSSVEIYDSETDEKNLQNKLTKKIKVSTQRIIRDTEIVTKLKQTYHNKCQICGITHQLNNGKYYSEGHHIIPIGGSHMGPDVSQNIIILCPNHHVEFDYGMIAINPDTFRVEHIDKSNFCHDKTLNYWRKDIDKKSLRYHYNYIFGKL